MSDNDERKNRGDARGVQHGLAPDEVSQVQGKHPSNVIERARHDGPSGPGQAAPVAPKTAGTPGGGLGAPDDADVDRDPEDESDKTDTRIEADER
jgi:hypothetical protein